MQNRKSKQRRRERGVTMVTAITTTAALSVLVAGGLLTSATNMQTSHNYHFSTQALYAAESGLLHAVKTVNGPGVVNYQTEVVDSWATVFGSGERAFDALTGFAYSIVPVATPWDTADPANRGTLRATAFGPFQTRTAVVARVTRSNLPSTSPGAIYLANDNPTDANFQGDAFQIDGNDRN
jgi:hypothetical protein